MWSDEVGPVRLVSGMPVKILQGAQYMNDAMGSMYGKLIQAVNYQKSTEFRGGIWDCNPMKEKVPSESCYDTSNNSTNKIFSLEEILACDDEDVTCETEMKDDYLLSCQKNTATEFSVDASCTDVSISLDVENKVAKFNASCIDESIDVKIKRCGFEEFDKTSLHCNNSETKRKKPKKNVSFSDIVVDLEDSFKSASKINKCVALDITAIKDDASNFKETLIVKENERFKNLILENVNDIPMEMEQQVSASEKTSAKGSMKFKNCSKLLSQSSEIDHDQQSNEQMPVKVGSSKKVSHKRCSSQKAKINNDIVDHEKVVNRISDNHKVMNEEFINRSHLEKAIPELFQLSESSTEDKADPMSIRNVKNGLKFIAGKSTNIENHTLKIKETSQSLEKKNMKGTQFCIDVDLLKNEVQSQTFEEDRVSKEIENSEGHLKNTLFEMFIDVSEKDKILSENKQMNCVAMMRHEKSSEEKFVIEQTCHGSKFRSEDKSQYESKDSAIQNDKVCCPNVSDIPSCTLRNREERDKDLVDIAIKGNVNRTDNKPEKVSLTSYQEGNNFSNSVCTSRSDACSNWRSQCIDVRLRDKEENTTPQSTAEDSWRNESRNSKNQSENSNGNNHKTRTEKYKKQQANKMNELSNAEYEGDDLVVLPIYLKEPPDPLSRFKNINNDPESIWDEHEEKTRPSYDINRIQSQIDDLNSKNDSELEEIHAFRKKKTTSVPKFFEKSTRTLMHAKTQGKLYEDQPSAVKIDRNLSRILNENYRSRSQSRQADFVHHRSYERNRSSSTHWRNSLSASSFEHDVFYVVKIAGLQDGMVEKLKILKEDFLLEVRENKKLSDMIPFPGCKPKKFAYSACAVKIIVRCIFSSSYQIPSWITALEAFALAKKFGVDDLKKVCEDYFANYKIASEQIELVAACALQLHAVDALKSSKFFQKVQNVNLCTQNVYTSQGCMVSCSVFMDTLELVIPLKSEVNRGIESVNESDVRNRVFFTSLARVTSLTGIQLKFLTDDISAQLKIICEVFQSEKKRNVHEKLFYQEIETNAKSSIKISFTDEITVKLLEEIEIVVYIEDVLLKICPQLCDNEIVVREKFHVKFETSKTNEKSKKLFCIEKLFYTSQT